MWLKSLLSSLSTLSFRKSIALIVLSVSILMMSWESQKIDAALMQTAIPEESIRLRILAHSDSPQDQAIKMLVRDRVVETMNSWANETSSIEDARLVVTAHMDELNEAVGAVLAENGQLYPYEVKLANVEFPTKSYGGLVYPGGEYEAVLVTLGDAKGRNWWCVLFPPLCFADTVSGEATAVASTEAEVKVEAEKAENTKAELQLAEVNPQEDIEVKFFLADAWGWFTGLFS